MSPSDVPIVSDYLSGMTRGEVAARHGKTDNQIRVILRRTKTTKPAGTRTSLKLDDGQGRELVRRYLAGDTLAVVGAAFGITATAAHFRLKRLGLNRHPAAALRLRHPINESAFDGPPTDRAAYFIGLLMADGNVHQTRYSCTVGLTLSVGDAVMVGRFRDFLGWPGKIQTHRDSGFAGSQPKVRVSVRSQRLADALARFGILPRKSHTAEAGAGIDANPHFWRGVIDGDGSVLMIVNRGVPMPVISLCGSRPLMEQFVRFVAGVSAGSRATVRPTANIWHVRITGRHAKRLAQRLYGDCDIALPRKLTVAHQVMAWVPKQKLAYLDKP